MRGKEAGVRGNARARERQTRAALAPSGGGRESCGKRQSRLRAGHRGRRGVEESSPRAGLPKAPAPKLRELGVSNNRHLGVGRRERKKGKKSKPRPFPM